jgi:esterase/lipase superfamily enzyme
MHREHHRWYSHRVGREMGLVVYGHWGFPILAFPTSGGDEGSSNGWGSSRRWRSYLEAGRVKVYCVGSNNQRQLPQHRAPTRSIAAGCSGCSTSTSAGR